MTKKHNRCEVMMSNLVFRSAKKRFFLLSLIATSFCTSAWAQENSDAKALSLVKTAMEKYGQLDLENAKASLDQALGLAPKLSKSALARVYVSYGVLWSGGFADNAKGQESFIKALCYDPQIAADPMVMTPDIETEFKLAKLQATPEKCKQLGTGTSVSGQGQGTPSYTPEQFGELPLCGTHERLTQQKQKYELPFYLELDPMVAAQIKRVSVKYAFDAPKEFHELYLRPMGGGYGSLLSCEEGQIEVYDPLTVYYYIEGRNAFGQLVCRHGSDTAPLEVKMSPDVQPMPPIVGMTPRECAPCAPWDDACRKASKGSMVPGLGDTCTPTSGCAVGLYCSEIGLCEMEKEKEKDKEGKAGGPSHFYVNLSGGTGVGVAKGWSLYEVNDAGVPRIEKIVVPQGFAWSGIPLRLGIGFFLSPKFSLELSTRFDVWVAQVFDPQNCVEIDNDYCKGMQDMENPETIAAIDGAGDYIYETKFQFAWLLNARGRYKLVASDKISLSLFGGLGYGNLQVRIPSQTAGKNPYFPMVSGFNIEVGPALSFYFNQYVSFNIDIPIDLIMGSGFGFNVDLALGLGFGF